MAGLGDTTARLKRLGRSLQGSDKAKPASMVEIPRFGPNPGGLRMLAQAGANPESGVPLVLVLHGCGQGAETFARDSGWLTLAKRYGFMVVAAEQSAANNLNRCFNWFEPGDSRRGKGEPASIAAMVAHAVRTEGVNPDRVFVTGLSAGGAMAAVMLATYPDLFAAGAVVAGLPYGVADGMVGAMRAMQGGGGQTPAQLGELARRAAGKPHAPARLVIWHGDADHTVRPRNAADLACQWADLHGLGEADADVEALPGRTRTVWRAAGSAEALIELNLVHGLGHGTPLSTTGTQGLGSPGLYMLEAGISSSLEIASFWGLAEAAASPATGNPTPAPISPAPVPKPPTDSPGLVAVGDEVMASLAGRVAPVVQEVIAAALKRAGLRRH